MDKVRSLYLDLLRISAAFYVFIFHFGAYKYYFSTLNFYNFWGLKILNSHYFVIVFFVLSGFLITMSANRPGVTLKSFLIARLGRLYSVLIPSLIFSLIVAVFLLHYGYLNPELVKHKSNMLLRFFLNLTFLAQSWSLCSPPTLNGAYWSVTYEFMYYLMIAATLVSGKRNQLLFLVIVLFIAGPKIILLAPAWLIGSLLYKIQERQLMDKWLSLFVFLFTSGILIYFYLRPDRVPFTKEIQDFMLFGHMLYLSWNYQADCLYALLVAINIYSLFGISTALCNRIPSSFINSFNKIVKPLSNCSYTLYLFHLPLLFLYALVLPYDKTNSLHQLGLITLVLLTVFLIARQTEWKVDLWRSYMERLYQFGRRNWFGLAGMIKKQNV